MNQREAEKLLHRRFSNIKGIKHKKKVATHARRFEAKGVDKIWRTYIHFAKITENDEQTTPIQEGTEAKQEVVPVLCTIDDKSRCLISIDFLP
jgi:hypothetical protein